MTFNQLVLLIMPFSHKEIFSKVIKGLNDTVLLWTDKPNIVYKDGCKFIFKSSMGSPNEAIWSWVCVRDEFLSANLIPLLQ